MRKYIILSFMLYAACPMVLSVDKPQDQPSDICRIRDLRSDKPWSRYEPVIQWRMNFPMNNVPRFKPGETLRKAIGYQHATSDSGQQLPITESNN